MNTKMASVEFLRADADQDSENNFWDVVEDQFDLKFFDLSRVFSRLQSFPELSFEDRENSFDQVSPMRKNQIEW